MIRLVYQTESTMKRKEFIIYASKVMQYSDQKTYLKIKTNQNDASMGIAFPIDRQNKQQATKFVKELTETLQRWFVSSPDTHCYKIRLANEASISGNIVQPNFKLKDLRIETPLDNEDSLFFFEMLGIIQNTSWKKD